MSRDSRILHNLMQEFRLSRGRTRGEEARKVANEPTKYNKH
jgi:hypothetical protein